MAKGLFSGRYAQGSVFTDSVRASWNEGGAQQDQFEARAAQVGRLSKVVSPSEEMVQAAIRYTFTHPAVSVSIPGAKSPAQAQTNAAAGSRALSDAEATTLREAIGN